MSELELLGTMIGVAFGVVLVPFLVQWLRGKYGADE